MQKIRVEGIITRASPFGENDRILSLFTPEYGLIKLYVKGAYLSSKNKGSSTNPLNIVEAVCTQGRSELYSCYQIEAINQQISLRQNIDVLEAACDMLNTINTTQLPGKAALKLYQLLLIYLKALPNITQPLILSTSFRLKTLRSEGLLNDSRLFSMTVEEQELIEVITLCRDISLLGQLTISLQLAESVKTFFKKILQ